MIYYLYALIALQVLDLLTTWWIIKNGGHEDNKVLLWLAEKLKPITNAKWAWLVVAKVAGVVLSYLSYLYVHEWVMFALVVGYVVVVTKNIAVVERMQRLKR